MNITDPIRYRARLNPGSSAVIRADDTAVTYDEFDQMIDAAAARIDGLGLLPGQIAGLAMTGPDEFPSLVIGLALARCGIASADPAVPASLVDIVLTRAGTPLQEGVRNVSYDASWIRLSPRGVAPPRPIHPGGSTICRVFATSGTTGTPRFAAVSHELMATRVLSHWLSAGPSEAVHICGVGHGISWGLRSVLRTFWGGGTLVLTNPDESAGAIRRHGVNSMAIAPVSLRAVASTILDGDGPLPSLMAIETGGGLLSPQLHDLVRRTLCDHVVSFFGSTETGGVASAPVAVLNGIEGAVGYVHAGVEAQAVDADDRILPPGTEGILRVRSDSCVSGYFGEATPATDVFRDGWFYPGDVGSVSRDGLMTVTGRISDFINAGGIKISPHVIEEVLLALPDVTDAAAFGVPDRLGVIQIWAAIVAATTVPLPDLNTVCREQLGGHAPKYVLQIKRLPRNANGKIARDELVRFALTQRP